MIPQMETTTESLNMTGSVLVKHTQTRYFISGNHLYQVWGEGGGGMRPRGQGSLSLTLHVNINLRALKCGKTWFNHSTQEPLCERETSVRPGRAHVCLRPRVSLSRLPQLVSTDDGS